MCPSPLDYYFCISRNLRAMIVSYPSSMSCEQSTQWTKPVCHTTWWQTYWCLSAVVHHWHCIAEQHHAHTWFQSYVISVNCWWSGSAYSGLGDVLAHHHNVNNLLGHRSKQSALRTSGAEQEAKAESLLDRFSWKVFFHDAHTTFYDKILANRARLRRHLSRGDAAQNTHDQQIFRVQFWVLTLKSLSSFYDNCTTYRSLSSSNSSEAILVAWVFSPFHHLVCDEVQRVFVCACLRKANSARL